MTETKFYTYTLTLSECIEAFGRKALAPKRNYAISLLVLAAGVSVMFYLLHPLVGHDPSKIHIARMGYIFSAAAAALGALLWRPEGRASVRRKTTEFEQTHRTYMTETKFSFDAEGWILQREGASEDKRKFATFKACRETPSLIILISDSAHIIPKRIFTPEEAQELRRLYRIDRASGATPSRTASVLDHGIAVFEYMLWRQREMLFTLLFLSLILAALAAVRVGVGARSGLEEFTAFWGRGAAVLLLTLCALIALAIASELHNRKNRKYGPITAAGYVSAETTDEFCIRWSYFSNAHEGWSCFFFEPLPLHHVTFPKRILSPEEKSSAKMSRKDGKEVEDHPHPSPVGAKEVSPGREPWEKQGYKPGT